MPRNVHGRGLNQFESLVTEERRAVVASLRRQRLSMRRIVARLEEEGHLNPTTGSPWSIATIHRDIEMLQDAARAEAMKDITEHKAEILAEYQELISLAWSEKRYDDVRLNLKEVRALLGTDSPQVIVFEQVHARMVEALTALEAEFADEPAVLERAVNALVGAGGRGATTQRSVN